MLIERIIARMRGRRVVLGRKQDYSDPPHPTPITNMDKSRTAVKFRGQFRDRFSQCYLPCAGSGLMID